MGRLLKLTGVTLTDATAPVIPHSAGVAGYTRRVYVGSIAGSAGNVVSVLPSLLDTGTAVARVDARATTMTLVDDTSIRAVQMPVNTNGFSQLYAAGAVGDTNPFTLMAVVKIPAAGVSSVALNGLHLQRAGDGSFTFGAMSGSFGGSGYALVAGNASWACLVGTFAGGASSSTVALYANGIKGTTGSLPVVPSATETRQAWMTGSNATQVGSMIAEVVAWPFMFNDTQADAARQAMKAKYPALP